MMNLTPFVLPEFYPAMSEIFMLVMILTVLLATTFSRDNARGLAYWVTQATLLSAAGITLIIYPSSADVNTFSGMYVSDALARLLKIVVYFSTFFALVYGRAYLAVRRLDRPEFYVLVLLMTLGIQVMISASHLLSIYIGLEMMSLSLYALVAFDRDSGHSTEAGMKYFVLGALASGLLLYGMSLIYGATGSLDLNQISKLLADSMHAVDPSGPDAERLSVLKFGVVFLMAGIAFKLGLAPFHMWVPDVYQGAPTAVTLLISSAPKIAAFAMAYRLFVGGLSDVTDVVRQWQGMLIFVAAASIVIGNLAAVVQRNIKRMLAYSGISHMGFMVLGLLSGAAGHVGQNLDAYTSAVFYAIAYVIMTLAAFGMVALLSRVGFEAENIEDFKGLSRRSPWFALLMLFTMFSMAGIPFFVGFFAKLAVLEAVIAAGHLWLAVLAVVMSVIAAFYYLRIVKFMYFDEPLDNAPIVASGSMRTALSLNGLAIALFGLAPGLLFTLCSNALKASGV